MKTKIFIPTLLIVATTALVYVGAGCANHFESQTPTVPSQKIDVTDIRTRCIGVGKKTMPDFDESYIGPTTRYAPVYDLKIFKADATVYYALDTYKACISNELGFDSNPELKQLVDNAESAQTMIYREIIKVFSADKLYCIMVWEI